MNGVLRPAAASPKGKVGSTPSITQACKTRAFEAATGQCPSPDMSMTKITVFAALMVGAALASPSLAATALPGGASSLTETHGDWTVRCATEGAGVICEVRQEQQSNDTQQRVLAIGLGSSAGGTSGNLVLPFGLLLANGAVLRIDDKPASPPQPFQTCVPSGCLVPLKLDAAWTAMMRAGTVLGISAQSVSGQDAKFSVSLRGFSSALDRIADLTK